MWKTSQQLWLTCHGENVGQESLVVAPQPAFFWSPYCPFREFIQPMRRDISYSTGFVMFAQQPLLLSKLKLVIASGGVATTTQASCQPQI